MSNRVPGAVEPSAEATDWDPLPRLGFMALLGFLLGGFVGGLSNTPGLGLSPALLFVNGRVYGIVLLTALMVVAGYGIGRYAADRG